MASKKILTIRKEDLFKELTALSKKVRQCDFPIIVAKTYLRRMDTLEASFRALNVDIITYNVDKDKADIVNINDLEAFIELIDFINKNCLTGPSLQKIQIPIFDGAIEKWENFISLFDSLVHNQEGIDDATKLQYLRLYTAKEAHATVSRFILQDSNYAPAYDALKKRYANNRRIAAFHIQRLVKFVNKGDLLHYLEVHRTSTSALANLQLNDLADFILFQIAYNNCDPKIKASFDNENASELPKLIELLDHVEKRARSHEMDVKCVLPTQSKTAFFAPPKPNQSRTHITQARTSSQPKCRYCNADHQTFHCQQFRELSPADRTNFIKSSHACFNCFGSHEVKDCKSKVLCRICNRAHHSLLHLPTAVHTVPSTASPPAISTTSSSTPLTGTDTAQERPAAVMSCVSTNQVLLATILCKIQDSFGNLHDVCALLDSASQRCLVTSKLANRLGLQRKREARCILGVSGRESTSQGSVQLTLQSRFKPPVIYVTEASVLPHICDDLPTAELSPDLYRKFSQLPLADNQFHRQKKIDILLGADAHANLLTEETPNLIPGQPTAQRTKFGWVIFGATPELKPLCSATAMLIRSHPLESTLTRFWEIEQVSMPSAQTNPEDVIAEEHYINTHTRDSEGRYVLRLPFRPGTNPKELSNRSAAEKCLRSLERRLGRQPQVKLLYSAFMQEFIEMKHMQLSVSPSSYVLPHHCVMKESTSTKLRCVFNASAKDVTGTSLNQLLLPGPKLQADISDILIRFRFHNVALCSDIKMMFRQLAIHPEDRQHQHVFWRESPEHTLQEYEITRVVYGMASSSFLAQRTLRQLAADEGHRFPNAAIALVRDFYMDDYVGGSSSIAEAKQLRKELTELLDAGCMPLRKWSSSNPRVLDDIPDSHKEVPLEFSTGDPMLKILGLCYLPQEDAFSYRLKPFEGPATKRSVLGYVSRCYDPLGLLCGVICRAKQFIQSLWLLRSDWDEPLPEPIQSNWKDFLHVMSSLPKFRIPRCFNRGEFAEAHLVKAKSRVAPLKTLSIPRLELLGSLLASQLINSVLHANPGRAYSSIHMLTDSTIVLAWLKTPPHLLNTFVANRVVTILDLTKNYQWARVPSEFNAADCASRGCIDDQIWWHGPSFMSRSPEHWNISIPMEPDEIPERKVTTLVVQANPAATDSPLDIIERFSSLSRLQRIVANIRRFAHNASCKSARKIGPLSVSELSDALLCCVRITQAVEFSEEIKQLQSTNSNKVPLRLSKLSPYIDEKGFLRVGGRLRHSLLPSESKYPLLLPKKCHLSSLICDYYHKQLLHAGPRQTMSFIQRKFWILAAHSLIRQRIYMCRPCFRLTAAPRQPIMADLPACRVQPAPPFYTTASDFAGPFETKETTRRNSPRHKSYCCIFVDTASKAVHLEAVTELSTAAFMAAFHRFCARRSLPATLHTDCGRNYLGAARQLKEVTTFLKNHQDELYTQLASLKVKWCFNPPAAPNFGGIFEAAVKLMKLLMYRQIGNTILTFEELSTFFARVEAVLNSRPLGMISSDPREGSDVLTPGHLLVGRPLVAPPELCLTDTDISVGSRWQRIHALSQSFWRRWSSEYLHTQMQRQKWTRDCPNPTVGSFVYITGLSSSPLSWPLGVIERVHHSNDSKELFDGRYVVFRKDRNKDTTNLKDGGGVLVAIDKRFHLELVDISLEETLLVKIDSKVSHVGREMQTILRKLETQEVFRQAAKKHGDEWEDTIVGRISQLNDLVAFDGSFHRLYHKKL
ncbi:uncharacterized protein LOC116164001 [Photinus pyralis]|uniref:uncharacterized protein LOC116164001 n=1 Tax=Photinus pyralis TaxID=7054 RepID=UPI00126708E6|nr:uncharacterized protein LOC116164001 [Photinus pyralis]